MAKALPLLKLIMASTDLGAVSTIFKVFGMTRTRTWDLPIHIHIVQGMSFAGLLAKAKVFYKSVSFSNFWHNPIDLFIYI